MKFPLILERLPVSVNACFATDFKTKRRFKTKEYKEFESYCRGVIEPENLFGYGNRIGVEVDFYSDWETKKGTIRKVDIANYEKSLIDCMFPLLNLDDSQIFSIKLNKKPFDEKYPTNHTCVWIFDIDDL